MPHDLKALTDMCALLATHTPEGTSTSDFYCPTRVRRSYLLEIGNPGKKWVLYHNSMRVGLEVVEHGDYFVLFEKVPRKTRSPFSLDETTSELTSASLGNADQRPPAFSSSLSTPACLGLFLPPPSSSLTLKIKVPLLMINYCLLHNSRWIAHQVLRTQMR